MRPWVPFCRTSQSSAPVAFRQCGPVVLVHNELLCSFTMGAFSAKCQPSKQSSSSQYTVGALSTKGEQGALLSGLGCFFLGPRNHRRQRHFVNMAVLCFFSIAADIAIYRSRAPLLCLIGVAFVEFAKSLAPMALRRCGPVVLGCKVPARNTK